MDHTWRTRLVTSVLVVLLVGSGFAGLVTEATRTQATPGGIAPVMSRTTVEWRECATVYFELSDYYGNLGESVCGALTVPEN